MRCGVLCYKSVVLKATKITTRIKHHGCTILTCVLPTQVQPLQAHVAACGGLGQQGRRAAGAGMRACVNTQTITKLNKARSLSLLSKATWGKCVHACMRAWGHVSKHAIECVVTRVSGGEGVW